MGEFNALTHGLTLRDRDDMERRAWEAATQLRAWGAKVTVDDLLGRNQDDGERVTSPDDKAAWAAEMKAKFAAREQQ